MLVVYGHDYKSPLLDALSPNINVLSTDEMHVYQGKIYEDVQVCVTHEEALEALRHKMTPSTTTKAMELFRNKFALRSKLSRLYPAFYFSKISLSQLSNQILDFKGIPQYVMKPVKGFFGIGVHIITPETNLKDLQSKIEREIKAQGNEHPEYIIDNSLSIDDFMLEEYIGTQNPNFYALEDAEIAVDGYYNNAGDFTLLSIYHHPSREDKQYFHLMYYTSKELFDLFSDELIQFFESIQKNLKLNIRSFPIHAEFRNSKNKLFLIEINPGRFGGLGLGDLTFYAFGVNPYSLFFANQPFDWEEEWRKVEKKGKEIYFAWILAYRGEKFKNLNGGFDHDQFKKFLGDGIMRYEAINHDHSVFSIAFIKKNTKEELEKILNVDFNIYHIAE